MIKDAPKQLQEVIKNLDKISGSPVVQKYLEECGIGYETSKLDPDVTQLICIAICCATNASTDTILFHMNMFIEAGGTREALETTMDLVVMACGGPGTVWAWTTLDAYDQLLAAKNSK